MTFFDDLDLLDALIAEANEPPPPLRPVPGHCVVCGSLNAHSLRLDATRWEDLCPQCVRWWMEGFVIGFHLKRRFEAGFNHALGTAGFTDREEV